MLGKNAELIDGNLRIESAIIFLQKINYQHEWSLIKIDAISCSCFSHSLWQSMIWYGYDMI